MISAGKTVAEVYQKLEITESTWQRWQKQFGGMKSEEAKRLRDLELENRRLKEMLAEAEQRLADDRQKRFDLGL